MFDLARLVGITCFKAVELIASVVLKPMVEARIFAVKFFHLVQILLFITKVLQGDTKSQIRY